MKAILLRHAQEHALTRSMLRGGDWESPSRGLYGARGTGLCLDELAQAVRLVLPPDSGFGHLTGAQLRGWWMPPLQLELPLMATSSGHLHVQRRGVYVRRSPDTGVEDRNGVPLVAAAETLLELARDLALVDLVPMVDCALRRGDVDVPRLHQAARPKVPGVRTFRRAVALADRRSESWWESVLRLLHVVTGIPVEPQAPVVEGGQALAYGDLRIVGTNRLVEYDGADHRDRERHHRDLARDKALSRLGLDRYGYVASEISGAPGLVLRDAEAALGWPHDPSRLSAWLHLASGSTLAPPGRARLRHRLARYGRASDRRQP